MDRFAETRQVAVFGILTNLLLLFLKLTVGFISRSQAMIADGFNSAQDVFASGITLLGNRIASRPEDKDHPYGHGKAEYIFSMIISFSLLMVAVQIFRSALTSILARETLIFSWWLVAVAAGTILLKSILFLYTRQVGRRQDNLLIAANAADHRNDVFVTSGTLIGIFAAMRGVYWMDGVVGIGISLWILCTGISIFAGAYHVLMDTNLDPQLMQHIQDIILSIQGVDHLDDVTAKPIGVGYILIVKVSVSGSITVTEGHSIAAQIKERLKDCRNCSKVGEVVVHVNPA